MKMNHKKQTIAVLVCILCLGLLAGQALAQSSTTGSIEGTVIDTNGAAVPGVAVTVTSPNMISAQSGTTNDQGRYRILNLPPGKYLVTVEAVKGFGKSENSVEVNLSKTATVDVQLKAQQVGESVTVTANPSTALDITTNTTGSNISTEQFSSFPTERTVQSLFTIAPTVARSGLRDASGRDVNPSVAGASGPENHFILDGVNTTDPAFGGSGANLPFEFVQEVEIKTGAFGAEFGMSTGGIFNVITKSGGNDIHGDGFAYFSTKGMVRSTNEFPLNNSSPDGFSELDAGVDVGGPIKKDKLWFFAAANPQLRKNYFETQVFRVPVSNKITTPFYSGKVTWAVNQKHTFTFSTFGDFTKQTGFVTGGSGFAQSLPSFDAVTLTGGQNYTGRVNSSFNQNWTGEFSAGLHLQRFDANGVTSLTVPSILDNFAVLRGAAILNPTSTNVVVAGSTGFGDFINGTGGVLERNYFRGEGFGLYSNQNRNRVELQARMQNLWGRHTFKYGVEYNRNVYKIDTRGTGTNTAFDGVAVQGYRVTNNFGLCAVQTTTVVCPTAAITGRVQALLTAGINLGGGINATSTNTALTAAQLQVNPFLIRTSTRVRDFRLFAPSTHTDVEAFYFQDDVKLTRDLQVNLGLRWDYQQAYGSGNFAYVKLNNFKDNIEPRLGFSWDFTHKGKGKIFANYAKFIETPLPLDINVRAGSDTTQNDINLNVDTLNAPLGSHIAAGGNIGNLGSTHTPIDPGLKPQDVREYTAGINYELTGGLTLGLRGIYRAQGNVIEDGSFDDGTSYFLFNPGRRGGGETTEDKACTGTGGSPTAQCFGHARRYFRALEFTATKRLSKNYQFVASYVYSSLIGNYEGLFRNDNGQTDPNITSLFDLVSLLFNQYGRLPNDRPHQFKYDGSYTTPWKVTIGTSLRAQSGIPFNALIPHPIYGNNEGFALPRGTAIVPTFTNPDPNFPNEVQSVGSNRTPPTWNLDLNGSYPIKLGENKQLKFQVDWFNVLNGQRPIRLDETFSINSGISGAQALQFANAFYGAGTIFQFPSSVRLGVKFQF